MLSEHPLRLCHPDRARSAAEGPAVRLGWHEKGCPILSRTLRKGGTRNSIYAVILSEAPAQICHPDQARSAQWRDLQFASVGTKRGAPSFRALCERVGTATLRRHPERSALSDLSSRPSAKRAVEGPAVRLSWHEKGCPILSRTLRKSGNHNSINAVILSGAQRRRRTRTNNVRAKPRAGRLLTAFL
jgi:hypothetical protein